MLQASGSLRGRPQWACGGWEECARPRMDSLEALLMCWVGVGRVELSARRQPVRGGEPEVLRSKFVAISANNGLDCCAAR